MDNEKRLKQLYECATTFAFDRFEKLFQAFSADMPPEILAEACLMRAQLKLHAADATLLEDLQRAEQAALPLQYPCFGSWWLPDSPDRLIVFSKAPEELRRFLDALLQASRSLRQWYGESGMGVIRQIQSEILYFQGGLEEALALAKVQCAQSLEHPLDAISALYVQYRCYLAMGMVQDAQQCMVDIILMVGKHPECQGLYHIARECAILITSWSGDTSRYQRLGAGEMLPIFDDRLKAIQKGISRLSPKEDALVAYAHSSYPDACTMREYYMGIFHAVYWYDVGDYQQAKTYFEETFGIYRATGLLMPFVEYGKQIEPLLQYAGEQGWNGSAQALAEILPLSRQYEESLEAYRD